jgi:biotin-(acetyl-CoA carboxylase) ligase
VTINALDEGVAVVIGSALLARNLAFSYAHSSGKALHQLGGLSCVVGLAIVDVLSDLGCGQSGIEVA